jgi:hypothetical protein
VFLGWYSGDHYKTFVSHLRNEYWLLNIQNKSQKTQNERERKEKNQRIRVWMNEWMNQWINEWINESMNQWINEWINESMNQWMNQWINQWINEWENEPVFLMGVSRFSPNLWTGFGASCGWVCDVEDAVVALVGVVDVGCWVPTFLVATTLSLGICCLWHTHTHTHTIMFNQIIQKKFSSDWKSIPCFRVHETLFLRCDWWVLSQSHHWVLLCV